MPLFLYSALSVKGKKIEGKIHADTEEGAKLSLLRQKVFLLKLEALEEKKKIIVLKKNQILLFTKELAKLMRASLPLFEALIALEEKYQKEKIHSLFLYLIDQIGKGTPFSKALFESSPSFDLLYIAMIKNAEKTGKLEEALEELTPLLERELKTKKQIVSALLYPSLLFTFCLGVLSMLLFFVVPSLRELFEEKNLHPFTKIVFFASDLAIRCKAGLLLVLMTLIFSCFGTLFFPSWKKKVRNFFVKVPLFRPFFIKIALIRFCRSTATLLEGGLPLLNALSDAKTSIENPLLEEIIKDVELKISQGESLSKPFSDSRLIPPLVPRMLGIAEQSGNLGFTFRQIGEIYEEELETELLRFTQALQPALLIFLGALVGFVLLAVLLPLTDVGSFVT